MPPLYLKNAEMRSDARLKTRSEEQEKRFSFALMEMSRMYSYKECEVVVLPQKTDLRSFPEGSGKALLRNGDQLVFGESVKVMRADGLAPTDFTIETHDRVGGHGTFRLRGLNECVGEDVAVANLERLDIQAEMPSSLCLFNPCTWGLVNPDDYERRGWVRCAAALELRAIPPHRPLLRCPRSCSRRSAALSSRSPNTTGASPTCRILMWAGCSAYVSGRDPSKSTAT